jgi:uncharacterized protein YyaL (SSP411 family)
MLCALDLYLSKPRQIIIAGAPNDAMLRAVREKFLPNKIVAHADEQLVKLMPYVKEMKLVDGKATAYVCENFVCQLPTNDPEALRNLLQR